MNPDEQAKAAGHAAVEASMNTLEAIGSAVEAQDWRRAKALYTQLGQQAALGVIGCQNLVEVKRQEN